MKVIPGKVEVNPLVVNLPICHEHLLWSSYHKRMQWCKRHVFYGEMNKCFCKRQKWSNEL